MLQKLLTNVRTLSFAFVMVAMLGIGTMVPVQQVAAQEASSEQRAAMLAQINQLMQLITQLMAQMQMMQAAENGAGNDASNPSADSQTYDLEIESPRTNTTYSPGDIVTLRWDETNLDGEYGVIQLVGLDDNTERTLMTMVDIGREMAQVRIPNNVTGPKSVNLYNLVLRVAYIKDGDPKGEADSVRLRIKDDRHDNDRAQEELQRVIDELNSIGKKDHQDIEDDIGDLREDLEEYEERYEDVYQEAREYDLDDEIEDLLEKVDWYLNEAQEQYEDEDYDLAENNLEEAEDLLDELNDVLDDIEDGRVNSQSSDDLQDTINDLMDQVTKSQTPPGRNAFACNRTSESYGAGRLACYGMWDYGQAFGGDVNMCNTYSGGTGCEIKAPVCESGKAIATNYYSNRDLRGKSDSALRSIAGNLNVSTNLVREEVAGLWSYECLGVKSGGSTGEQTGRVDRAIVIGGYEGSYPTGVRHSYGYHPQGEVEVYLPEGYSGLSVLLVLTSYEPVKWKLTGPGTKHVGEVLATGYYDQEVVGLPSDVTVTMNSYESGDRNYMYTYDDGSRNYDALEDYIKDEYGVHVSQFYGSYSQDKVKIVGYKG